VRFRPKISGLLRTNRVPYSDTVRLFLLGLPVLLTGTWLGSRLYGRLDETRFRKPVPVLLLASGASLAV
jgi:hypothetical protein